MSNKRIYQLTHDTAPISSDTIPLDRDGRPATVYTELTYIAPLMAPLIWSMNADKILGRISAGTGVAEELSGADIKTIIDFDAGVAANSDVAANTTARHAHANSAVLAALTDAGSGVVISGAERTKLSGIETGADVTDAANVDTAGAVMQSDIDNTHMGLVIRDTGGSDTFAVVKANLSASVAPTADDDSADGYGVFSPWIDTTADKAYICLDASVGAAVWTEITSNGVANTGANTGGGAGIYSGMSGDVLQFRSLNSLSSAITVAVNGTVVDINLVQSNISFANLSGTVANSKLATMAANTIKANVSASTASPTDVAIAANRFLARSSTGNMAAKTITDFALSLVDDADATTARTTLGLGAMATKASVAGTDIVDDAVSNAKLADMAQYRIKGQVSVASGNPEDLTATQVTALLDNVVGDSGSGGTKGLVPAPAAGDAAKYLKGNGTWATVPGGLDFDDGEGDPANIGTTSDGTSGNPARRDHVHDLADDYVTNAKLANVATATIKGRVTAATGDPEDLTATQVRTLLNVEDGAEANNISDTNATDLTDAGNTTLHYHAADRSRANHTGTQTASTISDFDTAVSANSAVAANTAKVTNATHTGDVAGSTSLTIQNNAVTNAKAADVPTATMKGRVTAATGDPEDLTVTQVRTMLNVEDGAEANNISDANATDLTDAGDTVLHYHAADRARANHTGTQTASTISDFDTAVSANSAVVANTAKVTNATHTGDVAGSGALTIQNDAVSNAKLVNMAQNTIKGRITASTGDPEDLTATQVRTILNVENGATADMTGSEIVAAISTNAIAKNKISNMASAGAIGAMAAGAVGELSATNLFHLMKGGAPLYGPTQAASVTVDFANGLHIFYQANQTTTFGSTTSNIPTAGLGFVQIVPAGYAISFGTAWVDARTGAQLTTVPAGAQRIEMLLYFRSGVVYCWHMTPEEHDTIVITDYASDMAVGDAQGKWVPTFPGYLTRPPVFALETPTGGLAAQFDARKNGTTIYSTAPTIDIAEYTSATAATPSVLSNHTFAIGDRYLIDVDQVGSSTPGKHATVTFFYRRTY